MEAHKPAKAKFGKLLVDAGLITDEQLSIMLEKQKVSKKKLGQVLIENGIITQEDIIQVLEFQLGIPHINLDRNEIDPAALKRIPESLARRHSLIPIQIVDGKLSVAMSDPMDIIAIDDVKLFSGLDVIVNIATPEDIKKAISKYYSPQDAVVFAEQYKKESAAPTKEEEDIEDVVNSAPIVKIVNNIIEQAIKSRASDIHIEPQDDAVKVRYRVDGQLEEILKYDIKLLQAIITRVKITANMNIAEKRIPQDGRITVNLDGQAYDMRISSLPTINGEKVVMRITSKASFVKDKTQLGLEEDDAARFDQVLHNPYGIILVTGPTGSGKSTSVYAAVKELNKADVNIITVEDPVESRLDGINQVQVNTKSGLTFATALRSILRQDPDIIMIGEIRDAETASIAVSAAITGHLVLSTLHTNDAPSSISRLIDMGIEPFLIGSSLVGIVAQRLVKRICPKCIEEYEPDEEEIKMLENDFNIKDARNIKLKKGIGCSYCRNTGYLGRMGIFEILIVTPSIRHLIDKAATTDEIRDQAVLEGMVTLKNNGLKLALQGHTTLKEVMRVAYSIE